MKKSKSNQLTIEQTEALLAAAYTQVDTLKEELKVKKDFDFEIKNELNILRAAIRKLRKPLKL